MDVPTTSIGTCIGKDVQYLHFQVGSCSDVDDGLGHGLGLIIDKLKNIETKLDELKTIDQVGNS